MSNRYRFVKQIDAPIDVVWDTLTDHERYREFTLLPTSRLVAEGAEDRNGVGAVRHFGAGPVGTREEVLAFDAPTHMAYTIVAGLPVRDYRADVTLSEDGDGTTMTYEGSFQPTVPGTGGVIGLVMRTAVKQLIAGVAKRAEGVAAA